MTPRLQFALLRLWHAWLAGGFLVAWLSADEDTYAMHQFSGYAVLVALVVRVLAAAFAPKTSPWRLPRPRLKWSAKGRHPLLAWFAASLLVSVGFCALLGALADGLTWLEHPHEALANLALWVIGGHVAFVVTLFGGKRVWARLQHYLSPVKEMFS